MQNITINDYNLFGDYKVKEQNGKFYKFSNETQKVIIPESDIKEVEGFNPVNIMQTKINSYKYNLYGDYKVEKQNGRFYKFTDNAPVSVPESEIDAVKGFKKDKVLENDSSSSNNEEDVFMKNITSEKYKLYGSYTVEKKDKRIYLQSLLFMSPNLVLLLMTMMENYSHLNL